MGTNMLIYVVCFFFTKHEPKTFRNTYVILNIIRNFKSFLLKAQVSLSDRPSGRQSVRLPVKL